MSGVFDESTRKYAGECCSYILSITHCWFSLCKTYPNLPPLSCSMNVNHKIDLFCCPRNVDRASKRTGKTYYQNEFFAINTLDHVDVFLTLEYCVWQFIESSEWLKQHARRRRDGCVQCTFSTFEPMRNSPFKLPFDSIETTIRMQKQRKYLCHLLQFIEIDWTTEWAAVFLDC